MPFTNIHFRSFTVNFQNMLFILPFASDVSFHVISCFERIHIGHWVPETDTLFWNKQLMSVICFFCTHTPPSQRHILWLGSRMTPFLRKLRFLYCPCCSTHIPKHIARWSRGEKKKARQVILSKWIEGEFFTMLKKCGFFIAWPETITYLVKLTSK